MSPPERKTSHQTSWTTLIVVFRSELPIMRSLTQMPKLQIELKRSDICLNTSFHVNLGFGMSSRYVSQNLTATNHTTFRISLIGKRRSRLLWPRTFEKYLYEILTLLQIQGPSKTPKRLKWALGLLDRLFRRHRKCGYRPLLDKVCPSKVIMKP